jgi:hypothetical protein
MTLDLAGVDLGILLDPRPLPRVVAAAVHLITLNLFCAAILLALFAAVPPRPTCWLPADANPRGIYTACWTVTQLWT